MITGILLFCPGIQLSFMQEWVIILISGQHRCLRFHLCKDSGDLCRDGFRYHGCESSDSVMVSLSVPVVPVITAVDSALCPGDSVTIFSDQLSTMLEYRSTPTDSSKYCGTYSVTFDDGSGCGTNMSNTIGITVDTLPVVQITGIRSSVLVVQMFLMPVVTRNTLVNRFQFNSISIDIAGTFSVTVTDVSGCKAVTRNYYVSTTPDPMITGHWYCREIQLFESGSVIAVIFGLEGSTDDSISVNTAGVFPSP